MSRLQRAADEVTRMAHLARHHLNPFPSENGNGANGQPVRRIDERQRRALHGTDRNGTARRTPTPRPTEEQRRHLAGATDPDRRPEPRTTRELREQVADDAGVDVDDTRVFVEDGRTVVEVDESAQRDAIRHQVADDWDVDPDQVIVERDGDEYQVRARDPALFERQRRALGDDPDEGRVRPLLRRGSEIWDEHVTDRVERGAELAARHGPAGQLLTTVDQADVGRVSDAAGDVQDTREEAAGLMAGTASEFVDPASTAMFGVQLGEATADVHEAGTRDRLDAVGDIREGDVGLEQAGMIFAPVAVEGTHRRELAEDHAEIVGDFAGGAADAARDDPVAAGAIATGAGIAILAPGAPGFARRRGPAAAGEVRRFAAADRAQADLVGLHPPRQRDPPQRPTRDPPGRTNGRTNGHAVDPSGIRPLDQADLPTITPDIRAVQRAQQAAEPGVALGVTPTARADATAADPFTAPLVEGPVGRLQQAQAQQVHVDDPVATTTTTDPLVDQVDVTAGAGARLQQAQAQQLDTGVAGLVGLGLGARSELFGPDTDAATRQAARARQRERAAERARQDARTRERARQRERARERARERGRGRGRERQRQRARPLLPGLDDPDFEEEELIDEDVQETPFFNPIATGQEGIGLVFGADDSDDDGAGPGLGPIDGSVP